MMAALVALPEKAVAWGTASHLTVGLIGAERLAGRAATLRLIQLLNAGPFKVAHGGGRDEDRYGRKLRVLERHGRSLGAILVEEGLARR
jgi:endonuclease YncB( thermonuclease family)